MMILASSQAKSLVCQLKVELPFKFVSLAEHEVPNIPSSVLLGPYPPYLSMTMDISNFYLMTPLHHPEYIMQVNLINISDEVIEEYKLKEKATKSGSSTLWSNVTCMAYHNQDYWPTNCSRGNKMHTDVTQINQQRTLVPNLWKNYSRPSNSHWLSTILKSNMLSQNIISSRK